MFLIQTYALRDVTQAWDLDKIKSTWNKASINDRDIYWSKSSFTNKTIEIKVNTILPAFGVGVGKWSSGEIKSMVFGATNAVNQWYSTNSNINLIRNLSSITDGSVLKFVITNTNTIALYIDDTLIATDNCYSSYSNTIRIDDFTKSGYELDIDYVIIQ